MALAVTVQPGTASTIASGGTAVSAIPPNINGGLITNPLTAADQGFTDPDAMAEPLYVNPISPGALAGNGSSFALAPGQSWVAIPGQSSATWVNGATTGHRFSVVFW